MLSDFDTTVASSEKALVLRNSSTLSLWLLMEKLLEKELSGNEAVKHIDAISESDRIPGSSGFERQRRIPDQSIITINECNVRCDR
jgi:hypothetical protein